MGAERGWAVAKSVVTRDETIVERHTVSQAAGVFVQEQLPT
jgi:hypothetical protein